MFKNRLCDPKRQNRSALTCAATLVAVAALGCADGGAEDQLQGTGDELAQSDGPKVIDTDRFPRGDQPCASLIDTHTCQRGDQYCPSFIDTHTCQRGDQYCPSFIDRYTGFSLSLINLQRMSPCQVD